MSHDIYFLDEAFLPIFLTVGCFLGESLHSVLTLVLIFLNEINRGKVSLPNFFYRLEGFVKSLLVKVVLEDIPPLFFILVGKAELQRLMIHLKIDGACPRSEL